MAEENTIRTAENSLRCGIDGRQQPILQQIDNVVIENLEYPWKDLEDVKPTDLEYELFCGALESFWSKPLDEIVDDWSISLETVLPAIRSSIRMYSKSAPCEEKISEMDIELARWVEFGLSSSQRTSYAENSRVVMLGCSLAKQLSVMQEKRFSTTFCEPVYMHHIMDIILSAQYGASVRCEAAQALLHILLHPSTSHKFMLTKVNDNEYTPYDLIVHLFMKPQDVPVDLLASLEKVMSYFAFKFSCNFVIVCARRCFMKKEYDASQLLSSFSIVQKFFAKIKNCFSYTSRMAHQTILKNRIIPHICALATSPNQYPRVRQLAIQCLVTVCDFDGTDISGAIFLSHMDKRIISLVARLLQLALGSDNEISLLPYALRSIVLIDQLAAANEKCVPMIDAAGHVTVLQNMLNMMSVDEARCALISALSFGDNLKHVLRMCDIQKAVLTSENHPDDDFIGRFRQTPIYGYLCEILFALARSQSDGAFWRKHGPEIGKLIDCNLISAATSLKQWLEPFREELALGTGLNTLNFLLLRLGHHSEKYVDGDPPLSLVTLLRLIDAILDEPEKDRICVISSEKIRFDYCTRFYEDGLSKIINILSIANDEQSRRVHNGCTSLSGDSYIYCQFVRSATGIIHKLLVSLQAVNQNPDKTIVDALLRTYTLCCMDEACCDCVIRDIILKSFALFISPTTAGRQKSCKSGQRSFLKLFMDSGFEIPSNFFASLDVLRQLLPVPSRSLLSIFEIDKEEAISMESLWVDRFLECGKQLQFAALLGISSSRRLRLCLFDLFKRLARLSEKIALRLAEILMRQSLRMLTSSAYTEFVNVLDEDVLEEEESDVRFGNASDFVTASFYAFIAACSTDSILRNSMITVITQRRNYITTLMKFFKLASPKTAPHVSFQKHVIKIFHSFCTADIRVDGKVNYLPRDIYVTLCDSLVEHFGNVEHDTETALLALKNACDIGQSSTFGRAAINKSITANEGALLHFLDRFNATSEGSAKLLLETANVLADLFENVLTKELVKSAALKLHSSDDSKEHPLLRLKNKLTGLGCAENVLLSLQRALEVTTKAEPVEGKSDDLEAYEWLESAHFVHCADDRQQAVDCYKSYLSNLICHDYDDFCCGAALSITDLIMLNEEFFSGTVLASVKESEPSARLQNLNSTAGKVQRWKTLASDGSKRKRPYTISKTRPSAIRSKMRRF